MVLGLGLGHADALWIYALRGCSPVTTTTTTTTTTLAATTGIATTGIATTGIATTTRYAADAAAPSG